MSEVGEPKIQSLQDVHVILPVGGLATRALEVTEDKIPKHLIQLKNGKTVLGRVLHGLQSEGYKKFVFAQAIITRR